MPVAEIALVVLVTLSAFTDARQGIVPNAFTYPAWIFAWVLALGRGGWPELGASLLGFAVGFLPFFVLYLLGHMGGGDVKLMAAVGALMGYPFVFNALVTSIFVGAALGLLVLIWEGKAGETVRWLRTTVLSVLYPALERGELITRRPLPFGVAICLGSFLTLAAAWHGYASPADLLAGGR